jgi:hypothetical protein
MLKKAIISLSMLLIVMEAKWSKYCEDEDILCWGDLWLFSLQIRLSENTFLDKKQTTLTMDQTLECLEKTRTKILNAFQVLPVFVYQTIAKDEGCQLLTSMKGVNYGIIQLSHSLYGMQTSMAVSNVQLAMSTQSRLCSDHGRVLGRLQDGLKHAIEQASGTSNHSVSRFPRMAFPGLFLSRSLYLFQMHCEGSNRDNRVGKGISNCI